MIIFLLLIFKERMYQDYLKKVQQQRWERQQVYNLQNKNIGNVVILEVKIKSSFPQTLLVIMITIRVFMIFICVV